MGAKQAVKEASKKFQAWRGTFCFAAKYVKMLIGFLTELRQLDLANYKCIDNPLKAASQDNSKVRTAAVTKGNARLLRLQRGRE